MDPIVIIYDAFINGAEICTDTRSIKKGSIFFALKGANFNGNTFAKQALEQGAAFAVIDEDFEMRDSRFVKVADVLTALQQLATHHRMQLNIPFIGITGSNGKTTTKELVSTVLSEKYKTLFTKGNLNNHIGVPLTLLSVTKSHEIAVIEMGANHQKEIELLCSIARPTHVLITNVGKAHLEGFGGFEGVKKGKGEMYAYAKSNQSFVFINDDNADLKAMLGAYEKTIRYGKNSDCTVSGQPLDGNSYVNMEWKSKTENVNHTIHSQIAGIYNFENMLSAIAIGNHFGIDAKSIRHAIEGYVPDNQRSQEIVKGTIHILLDAYNANPTSMEAALRNLKNNYKGKKAIFLGDMLELGSASAKEHQLILQLVQSSGFDTVVLVGENFKAAGADFNARYFNNSTEALDWIKTQKFDGYHLLIKGSRGSKMEILLEGFQG